MPIISGLRKQSRLQAARGAYRLQHLGALAGYGALHQALFFTGLRPRRNPPLEALRHLQQRHQGLLQRDLEQAERGVYPTRLLFDTPRLKRLAQLPGLLAEMRRNARRRDRNAYRDLPAEVDLTHYPAYFRRNFHWQTDGYLSSRSARLYDTGVDFLFSGATDVMRRQAFRPLHERLQAGQLPPDARWLDIGCGTGRFLAQARLAFPSMRLCGLDLSPHYAHHATGQLAKAVPHVPCWQGRGEQTPFASHTFEVVSIVYVLHELPRATRRKVLREAHRLLRPDGVLLIVDSVQRDDAPELNFFLEAFAEDFHEPFYRDYIADPLPAVTTECGYDVVWDAEAFLSRVVAGVRSEGKSACAATHA